MSKKLYVGNLAFQTSEDGLQSAFEDYGNVVSVAIITDRDTGRSRGFGFVEMDSAEDAAEAIRQLDGRDLDGRNLRVNEAQERQRNGGQSRGGYRD